MVKSNAPLQIRLTEPVIFLRGPSTGLDFRGRPQVVRHDGQPAMLRGLLTLRLTKPTRIRSISIQLTGKARTEWPEGIGPRRLDTSDEHVILSESTTYFSSRNHSDSRSRSARRAASMGPGSSFNQWGYDDEDLDEDIDQDGSPGGGEEMGDWVRISRRNQDGTSAMRSASALLGTHDGTPWHRDGFSRRPRISSLSYDVDPLSMDEAQSLRERGPSPAYTATPTARPHDLESRQSPLRQMSTSRSSQEPGLSPISSAPPSRMGSIDANKDLEYRRASLAKHNASPEQALDEDELWTPRRASHLRNESAILDDEADIMAGGPSKPILLGEHRVANGDVHFAQSVRGGRDTDDHEVLRSSSPDLLPATNRAASIRTMDSAHSESMSSLSNSSQEHSGSGSGGDHHPTVSVIQPMSAMSTRNPSPISSTRRGRASSENLPRPSVSGSPLIGSPEFDSEYSLLSPPSLSTRRSSQLSRQANQDIRGSLTASPPESFTELPEVRQGRKSRLGSGSTIVENEPSSRSSNRRPSMTDSVRQDSSISARSASPGLLPPIGISASSRESSADGRGRHASKFSISAALRGLSKGRISSKSRNRADASRTPSKTEPPMPVPPAIATTGRTVSGSAIPPRLLDEQRTGRICRADSVGQNGDFVAPYGRGGAGRRPSVTNRGESPLGASDDKDDTRGRGRKKGMKLLTGALGFGADHEEEGVDAHDWKEFRKGTYNYPISFPIPVDAPPTIHAEFGSVTYRLKATVIRVGTLTLNLMEDLEVTMIASPQEDDLEESENVVVERQWEEQMRYQIALSGKAFPIGGIIPVSIRLMPLTKCKVHRLSILLEEKSDYYAQERKIARHETPKKFMMLFIKQPDGMGRPDPLLPIISDDSNAAKDSPLAPLALQAALNNPTIDSFDVDGHDDNMYATLLDPMGPWHLEKDLKVPDCASTIKFTTKHDKTNITIAHWLKVTIRVERGDDEAVDTRGKRKQFDIIIDTPIKILDCRVNPQWNSLPTYTANNPGSASTAGNVCSVHANKHAAPLLPSHRTSHQPTDPLISASTPPGRNLGLPQVDIRESSTSRSRDRRGSDATPIGDREGQEDTLLERNIVYDRLMSGQVTETGAIPPSYGDAVASASAVRARSASRGGRGMERDERGDSESRSRSRLRESVVA